MDTRTLCLGVLTERPMSGYEIKKHFEQAFRHFFMAGFGSIYPALAELARDGLVTVESVEQAKPAGQEGLSHHRRRARAAAAGADAGAARSIGCARSFWC